MQVSSSKKIKGILLNSGLEIVINSSSIQAGLVLLKILKKEHEDLFFRKIIWEWMLWLNSKSISQIRKLLFKLLDTLNLQYPDDVLFTVNKHW
jgi:hypothetical protein